MYLRLFRFADTVHVDLTPRHFDAFLLVISLEYGFEGAVAELLVELCNQQGARVRSCEHTNRSSEENTPESSARREISPRGFPRNSCLFSQIEQSKTV